MNYLYAGCQCLRRENPKDILYSKTIWLIFLAPFLSFLLYFPPSLSVYSLGHWQYKLDFQSERKLAFLGEVSRSPEEEKNSLGGI